MAIYVNRTTLRMPIAKGKSQGCIGSDYCKDSKLTFIGESPVAGVGVESFDDSLAARTAWYLSQQKKCAVHWQAIGKNGIKITKIIDSLLENSDFLQHSSSKQTTNYLVICLGVNDTKGFTSLTLWEQEITRLIEKIKQHCNDEIYFLGTPDMSHFPALPKPLGSLLGYRTKLLNFISTHHAYNGSKYSFIPSGLNFDASYLAEDGFHPSVKGCDAMGEAIAVFIHGSENT